jgi:nitroreductase
MVVMDNEDFTAMVAAACLAPSIHNSQPWRFDTLDGRLQVYADPTRAAPSIDPQGRGLLISCGAAVFNAAVVARARGRSCVVELADPGEASAPLASLMLTGSSTPTDEDKMLAEAVPARHTMREPFDQQQVPDGIVGDLRKAAEAEGAWLYVLHRDEDVVELAVLTELAEAAEQADVAYQAELAAWLRQPGVTAHDGIPLSALPGPGARGSDVPLRSFTPDAPTPTVDEPPPAVERPLLVVIGTDNDHHVDWVRAGMALQHLLLLATAAGLAASPMTQVIDRPATRAQLSHLLGVDNGHPQMVLRIGYGVAAPTTGRRPLEDVFRTHLTSEHAL